MSRPVIGRCAPLRTRTARSLEEAFGCGPHNRPALRRSKKLDLDMVIGIVCVAIVLALPWLTWKGII